jgi:hypothetical protein
MAMEPTRYFDEKLNTFFAVDHKKGKITWRNDGRELAYPDALPIVFEQPEFASELVFDLRKEEAPLTILNAVIQAVKPRLHHIDKKLSSEEIYLNLPNNLYDILPKLENRFPPVPDFLSTFVEKVDLHLDSLEEQGYNVNAFIDSYPHRMRLVAGRTVGNIMNVEMESIPFDPQSIFSPFETYGDEWSFAWWREVFQNSVDAINFRDSALYDKGYYGYKGKIDVSYEPHEDFTKVTIRDNGIGMRKDVLYRALLSFGGTGKRGVGGATGGFGKAKELIFVPWLNFEIETTAYDWDRNVAVSTKAIGKHFERQKMDSATETIVPGSENNPNHHSIGTTLTVLMGKESLLWLDPHTESSYVKETDYRVVLEQIEPLLKYSYLPNINLTINGNRESLTQGPKIINKVGRGVDATDQEPARVEPYVSGDNYGKLEIYVDKKKHKDIDIIMVRQNGMYMFNAGHQPENVKGLVRIECSGSALALYTDSRNALRYQGYISGIINTLATDGIYGLDKKREAVTLVQDGTDISQIQDEKIKRLERKAEIKFEDSFPDVVQETADSLKMDTFKVSVTLNKELAEKGEKRRVALKGIEDVIIEEINAADRELNESVEDGDNSGHSVLGAADAETIKQTLDKIPVRVTGQQFIQNNFWRPKQVIHSTVGPDVVDDSLWIKPNQYPEEYTFRLLDFWTNCVRLCATAIGVPLHGYSTGFVVAWDEDGNYPIGLHMGRVPTTGGKAILINPLELEPHRDDDGEIIYRKGIVKGFNKKQRWRLSSREDREELLAIAVHEVTHAQGYAQHNDEYASALTFNMAAIMGRGSRMLKHFYDMSGERYSRIKKAKREHKEHVEKIKTTLSVPLLEEHRPRKGRKKVFKSVRLTIPYIGDIEAEVVITKLQNVGAFVLEIRYAKEIEPDADEAQARKKLQLPIYIEIVEKPDKFSHFYVNTYSIDLPQPLHGETAGYMSLGSILHHDLVPNLVEAGVLERYSYISMPEELFDTKVRDIYEYHIHIP